MLLKLLTYCPVTLMGYSMPNQTMTLAVSSPVLMIFILQVDIHEVKVFTNFVFL